MQMRVCVFMCVIIALRDLCSMIAEAKKSGKLKVKFYHGQLWKRQGANHTCDNSNMKFM